MTKHVGKISVIGGSGFVGTWLCRRLRDKKIEFEILDLVSTKEFADKTVICDVRNISDLRRSLTGDVVVLLAAVHRDDISDPNSYHQTNVEGARNVALVCGEENIEHIIFASTVAVYGFAHPNTDETGQLAPFNEYGRSKVSAERELQSWLQQDAANRSLSLIRPTVIFGEGNRGNVYNLANQIASGRFLMIGNGKNAKSMAYIGNVAEFFLECILRQESGLLTCNYVDKPDLDMNTLVAGINDLVFGRRRVGPRLPVILGLLAGAFADLVSLFTGKKLPISMIRVRKFCSTTTFDSSSAVRLEFKPPFSIQDGLKRMMSLEFGSDA